jgi:hypothetical protein
MPLNINSATNVQAVHSEMAVEVSVAKLAKSQQELEGQQVLDLIQSSGAGSNELASMGSIGTQINIHV